MDLHELCQCSPYSVSEDLLYPLLNCISCLSVLELDSFLIRKTRHYTGNYIGTTLYLCHACVPYSLHLPYLALQAIYNSKYSVPYVSTLLRTAAPLSIDETEKQSHHNSAS
jgi:hypothetical protein